jgi:hypothetical protein
VTGKMQTYYYKVIIGLAVLAIIGTPLWLYKRYDAIRATVLEARKADTAARVQNLASSLIKPEDFMDRDPVRQRRTFETFFEAIQSPEVFRLKVYNHEPKIIWSNLREIIGQDASANQEAIDALNGKITSEFKSLKSEEVSERHFQEFTETYVPVQDAKGKMVGVIEVYQTAIRARENINGQFQKLAMITIVVVSAAFAGAAFILRFIFRRRGNIQN